MSRVLHSELSKIQIVFWTADEVYLETRINSEKFRKIATLFVHPKAVGVNAVEAEGVLWFLERQSIAPRYIRLLVMGAEMSRIPGVVGFG
jgi:hypothetical protein